MKRTIPMIPVISPAIAMPFPAPFFMAREPVIIAVIPKGNEINPQQNVNGIERIPVTSDTTARTLLGC